MNTVSINELKKSGLHESAHLVMLRKFGGEGVIEIKRSFDEDEKEFSGCVNIINITSNSFHKSVIGIAGYLAELIYEDGVDYDDAHDLFELNLEDLSSTDQDLIGDLIENYDAFIEAFNLIKTNWSEIEKEANHHFNNFFQIYTNN